MPRNFCASPAAPQPCCSACGARLHSGVRFCGACGSVQAAPAQREAEAIRSQFGASSADLAELLSAKGDVLACPCCNELNKTGSAYCGHCGQRLTTTDSSHRAAPVDEVQHASESRRAAPDAPIPPAARPGKLSARRYGAAIMLTLLGVPSLAWWQWQLPTPPASPAAQSAAPRSLPAPLPAATLVIVAPLERDDGAEQTGSIAPLSAAQSPASEIDRAEQERATLPVPPPAAVPRRIPPQEDARRKEAARTAMRRAAAPTAVDEVYRRRAAERCAEGLYGLVCREALRFELCEGKWTPDAPSGMKICRLNG